jgi:hypothetical protein
MEGTMVLRVCNEGINIAIEERQAAYKLTLQNPED